MSQQHTLGILPVGGGKNLRHQIPTYLSGRSTLIILPLMSLMGDRVIQLKINGEKCVACIHSGMDEIEGKYGIKCLRHGHFTSLSPEFLLQPLNSKLISMMDFDMVALGEAYCLSEWGYDLRPHYALTGKVTKHFKEVVISALTAAAPSHLQGDLTETLKVQPSVIKTTMSRPNISLRHLNFHDSGDKIKWLLPFPQQSGPTIIYVSPKKICLNLAQLIHDSGSLTSTYHGDMNYQERHTVQQQFPNNDISVIVAASAFGMGINKKDIRTITHFHLSTSPFNYIQEIGHTGRDGKLSQVISLFQPDDRYILEALSFVDMMTEEGVQNFEVGEFLVPDKQDVLTALYSFYSIGALKQVFKKSSRQKQLGFFRMTGYCKLDRCRWKHLLEFFGEYPPAQSRCCDNDSNITDITILSKKRVIRSIGSGEKL